MKMASTFLDWIIVSKSRILHCQGGRKNILKERNTYTKYGRKTNKKTLEFCDLNHFEFCGQTLHTWPLDISNLKFYRHLKHKCPTLNFCVNSSCCCGYFSLLFGCAIIDPVVTVESLLSSLTLCSLLCHIQPTHWKRPWCWERWKAKGKEHGRGWDV